MTRMLQIAMLCLGLIAGAAVASMPQASVELLFSYLSLPSILSFGTPPVGAAGRTVLALVAMLPFGVLTWLIGGGTVRLPSRWRGSSAKRIGSSESDAPAVVAEAMPTLRRADAHPDAPARWPIRASEDLGPPLPMITAPTADEEPEPEQPLPVDLDQPIAPFDPSAIPEAPLVPVRAVSALVPTPPPGVVRPLTVVRDDWQPAVEGAAVLPVEADVPEPEAVPEPVGARPLSVVHYAWAPYAPDAVEAAADTAAPVTVADVDDGAEAGNEPVAPALDPEDFRAAGEPVVAAEALSNDTSIAALLERLERGAQRRKPPVVEEEPAGASLDETLVMLRRLAAQ